MVRFAEYLAKAGEFNQVARFQRLDRARLASRTMITWSKGYPDATGRDFDEVMAELGLDDEAAVARLAPAGAIYFLMDPADVGRIFSHPLTMVGSDGLPFDPHPHPRQWGTFTNVLRAMVREQGLLTLETAVDKGKLHSILHYDGLPMSASFVVEGVEQALAKGVAA